MRTLLIPVCLVLLSGCATTSGNASGVSDYHVPSGDALSRYLEAVILQRGGHFNAAVDKLEQVVRLEPTSRVLSARLVNTYLRMQNWEKAAEAAEGFVERFPDEATGYVYLGGIYNQLGRYEESAEAFRRAIVMSPDDTLIQEALLEAETRSNDLVGALETYEQLIQMSPGSASLHAQHGLILMRLGDTAEAREALERSLAIDPQQDRVRFLLGVLQWDDDLHREALNTFQVLRSQQPNYPNLTQYIAATLVALGQRPQAINELERLIIAGQAEPNHHLQAMYLLLREGEPEQAIELAPPTGAPILATLLRAIARREQGLPFSPILDTFDRVEGDVHQECDRYLNDTLYLFGQEDTANYLINHLVDFRERGASSNNLDTILARLYMNRERYEEAEPIFQGMLEVYGDDVAIHNYLAMLYEAQDRWQDAERHLRAILDIDENDHNALNFLGYLWADENVNLEEAKKLIERALELDPNNGYYLDSLGWVYYRMGDGDNAVEHIRNALIHMDSDDAVLRDHLGDAYLLQGNVEEALRQWRRAIRLDPELEGVQEKIDAHGE